MLCSGRLTVSICLQQYIRTARDNTEIFLSMENIQNIIFLDGGILTKNNDLVAQAGDVVTIFTLKKLVKLFPKVEKNTKIMIINKNE